jgi:hypothetical protein
MCRVRTQLDYTAALIDLYEWERKYNQVWSSGRGDQEIWKNQETKVAQRIGQQQIVSHKVSAGENR